MSSSRASFALLLAACAVMAPGAAAQARVVQAQQLQTPPGVRWVTDAGARDQRALEIAGDLSSLGVRAGGLVRLRVRVSACAPTARLTVKAGAVRSSRLVRAGGWRTVAVRLPTTMSAVRVAATAPGRPACRAARLDWIAGHVALAASAQAFSVAAVDPVLQWGLIGNQIDRTSEERAAGVGFKVVRLSWKDFEPTKSGRSESYVAAKQHELAALAADGMRVVLDLGLHDTPQWLHSYPDSYLVNQYGERWTASTDGDLAIDKSDANLIFNAELRKRAAIYTTNALRLFGASAMAVRIGGGRYNELGYPAARTTTYANTYWAYDARAQAGSPVRGWKPGSPSPNGEAGRFLEYYLGALEKFQRWQIATARRAFAGPLIVLHPSWGLRPGQAPAAVARDLAGDTSAEINGEVQRGHDVARFVAAIDDPLVYVATTWLDAPFGSDTSTDPAEWRPAHYLSDLAARNPRRPRVWGENTGQGDRAALDFSAAQARRFGLDGIAWFREEELFSGRFATLGDLREVIARAP